MDGSNPDKILQQVYCESCREISTIPSNNGGNCLVSSILYMGLFNPLVKAMYRIRALELARENNDIEFFKKCGHCETT